MINLGTPAVLTDTAISGNFSRIYCVDSPGFGGAEINLLRVLAMSPGGGILVLHSAYAAPDFLKLLGDKNIATKAVFSRGNSLRTILKGLKTTFRWAREFPNAKFIVWCHHLDSNRWLQFGLALRKADFIVVEQLVPVDRSELRSSRITIPLKRFVSKRARCIVLNGHSQLEHYSKLMAIPTGRLRVIANSRAVTQIRARVIQLRREPMLRHNLGLEERSKVVVCVGRLSEQKGQDVIIEAEKFLQNLKTLQIVLVGEGEKRSELEAQAQSMSPGRIKFAGHCEDVTPYLAAADMFVLPSQREGLPGALIEAMSAGLPCIATDIPGNRELIAHSAQESSGISVGNRAYSV
jgi:glycosyltransferase involved in cell wall biosynthesis